MSTCLCDLSTPDTAFESPIWDQLVDEEYGLMPGQPSARLFAMIERGSSGSRSRDEEVVTEDEAAAIVGDGSDHDSDQNSEQHSDQDQRTPNAERNECTNSA